MKSVQALLLMGALVATSTACGLFQKAAPAPRAQPEAGSSASADLQVGDSMLLDRITEPAITRDGHFIRVSTPEGFSAAIDMRELMDVDNGFRPIGEDPDEDWIAEVLMVTLRGLFEMGYYDERRTTLDQGAIDQTLRMVRFAKPFKVALPAFKDRTRIVVLALGKDRLVAAVILRSEPGYLGVSTVEYANTLGGLPAISDYYPALTRPAAYRAASLLIPGFSVQSARPDDLERIEINVGAAPSGALNFYWWRRGSTEPYLVHSQGMVFRHDMPYRIQDLAGHHQSARVTEIGRIKADPADFAELRK